MSVTLNNDSSSTTQPDRPRTGQRERRRRVRFVLLAVLGLNVGVAAAKITMGLLIGSLAMSADGFHSLLDGASNIVALIGLAVASRPPDPNHPYGHHRFETLTSLGIASFMLLALFGILQGAWSRLESGGTPEVSTLAFVVMGVTLTVNIFVTAWERRAGRELDSSLLLADARHTMSDIFVSLSVVATLVVVWLGAAWADLVVSIGIAAAIGWAAWSIVRDASLSLSDVAVRDSGDIEQAVLSVNGVQGTHNIRSRGADGRVWVDLHIQVDPTMNVEQAHDIASDVARRVEGEFSRPADVTVHVEPATEPHLSNRRGYTDDHDD